MPTDVELAGRLLAALVLGGAIGFEREVTGRVAGLRTHMSVALGAALFAIVSAYGFEEFVRPRAETNTQVDVTRVASNIVTGIGFLGGGAIIKEGASVRGLTTAASLWVAAAAGLAAGLGTFFAGVLATALLIASLTALRAPRRFLQRFALGKETVVIRLGPGADPAAVLGRLQRVQGVEIRSVTLRRDDGGDVVISADVRGTNLETKLAELAHWDDVSDLDITS